MKINKQIQKKKKEITVVDSNTYNNNIDKYRNIIVCNNNSISDSDNDKNKN